MTSQCVLAVDFGGTKVAAALVDDAGRVLEASRARAATGRGAASRELEDAVRSVLADALAALPAGARIAGAGIGAAGPIDRASGRIWPLNVPAWRAYPLRDLVAAELAGRGIRCPVALELDGAAIALGEHWRGAGRGVRNLMGMVVSTGIGGGLVLDGRLFTGPGGNAGHIGHVDVAGTRGEDTFGDASALEAIASGPHTLAWARAQGFEGSSEDLVAAEASGDPLAIAAIHRTGQAVGRAIASAGALLELELVAIGGGFAQACPRIVDIARETVAGHHLGYVRRMRVVPSALGADAPLVGAAALIHRAELVPLPSA